MKRKRYYGEEAQRVTRKDCEAADRTIAGLKSGALQMSDVMAPAPEPVPARIETYFQKQIREKHLLPFDADARHVEGYIRLQYSTLSHLDWPTIRRECRLAVECIKVGGADAAERNAVSFGL